MSPPRLPILVAHRGWPARYPENTLESLQAAVLAGVRFIEFDIQLSRDRVPVLCHDASLKRTTGLDRLVMDLDIQELITLNAGERQRFGERYAAVRLPQLAEVAAWLKRVPQVRAFVEIKRQSLRHFGRKIVVRQVMSVLQPALDQCIVISFDYTCLSMARRLGAHAIGWALGNTGREMLETAGSLQPDYLFAEDKRFTEIYAALPGDWQWIVYAVQDPQRALQLAAQGAEFVETNAIGEMLMAPEFAQS